MKSRVFFVLLALLLLNGCSSPRIGLEVASLPNVNPDSSSRPSPVIVKIYEMRNDMAFRQGDFQTLFMEPMKVLGADLGELLFHQQVGQYLLPLALAMALSCFCSVLGAILNGVGQQRAVAAVSLLGGGLQLGLTLVLVPLPGVGMKGYVAGILAATLLETLLCLRLAVKRAGLELRIFQWLTAPGLSSLLAALTTNLLFRFLKDAGLHPAAAGGAGLVFALVIYLAALHAQGVRLGELIPLRIGGAGGRRA